MFWRRKRPWYTPLFALAAVLYGFARSEQLVPLVSRWMDMDWLYEHGKALWDRIRS